MSADELSELIAQNHGFPKMSSCEVAQLIGDTMERGVIRDWDRRLING